MGACSLTTAFACWHTEIPKAVRRANSLNLRATDDGKARRGMKLELRPGHSVRCARSALDGRIRKKEGPEVSNDRLHGPLSFGEVKGGRYWVVPEGGTLADSRAVEVSSPVAGTAKRVWLKHYGDECLDVSVENADQELN